MIDDQNVSDTTLIKRFDNVAANHASAASYDNHYEFL